MSDDILSRIDAVMEANRVRFDPLAGNQYGSRDSTDGMRWRPEGSGPPAARPHPASPYLTREDITGQRDRINDALRAEVLRQGLTECEIDGVAWEYRDGAWKRVEGLRLIEPPPPWQELASTGPWTSFEPGDQFHVEGFGDFAVTDVQPDGAGIRLEVVRADSPCPDVPDIATRRPWWKRWATKGNANA